MGGLVTPESDFDVCGVVIPPKEYFLGFAQRFEQAEATDPDLIIYDIRKFVCSLLPGTRVLELL
jgi:predicted nucleotidyltransferase